MFALVTGAGQNVGAGIARMLAAQGAAVAVNGAPSSPSVLSCVAHQISDSAIDCPFDVTDLEAVKASVAYVGDRLGPLDILVNNAGNGGSGGMRAGLFARSLHRSGPSVEVNLYGVMNRCKAVIDVMCERRWGRILTISSGAGTGGVGIGVAAYSAGKGGGISLLDRWRSRWGAMASRRTPSPSG